tara:strand:+ start:236 stop:454 length:219 start_codon:yes stop_codon:yes gene_type:complete
LSAKEHGQFTGVFKLCCVISLYQQIMCLVEVIHNDHTAQYFYEKQASTKKVIILESDDTHHHHMGNGDVIHG